MMKSEVAALLAFCAAYDQRTIGKSDVEAWAEALDSPWVPDIDMDEAQSAVVAHYRETSQRINVADVLKRVKSDRADRISRTALPRRPGRRRLRSTAGPAPRRACLSRRNSGTGWPSASRKVRHDPTSASVPVSPTTWVSTRSTTPKPNCPP